MFKVLQKWIARVLNVLEIVSLIIAPEDLMTNDILWPENSLHTPLLNARYGNRRRGESIG